MRKVKFVFGSHCHQPVGNFDFIFERAMRDAYEPFFIELGKFPDIRMSAHISGPLIEWIEEHRPQFIEQFGSLVERGQLELLSGGFYEPVLAAIPKRDRLGQIEMMNHYLRDQFGLQAAGAWMTERVWEPQVVRSLLESGLRYIVIDDYHLKAAGMREESIDGYYVTENDGRPLAIFPISETLRYSIPFADPQETINYLRGAYDAGKKVVTMMDDGEKFGLWPGTNKLCYEEGWLGRFFRALVDNSDWLELAMPSEILSSQPPTGIVYLPTASYFEMSEWTLPAEMGAEFSAVVHELRERSQLERFRPFLRGGIWRNFISKYPETNNMHKRMLALSDRIERLRTDRRRKDKEDADTALRELYRSQCNCAYWHGVFGGLYLPHLRDAVYRHIIRAEKAADRLEYSDGMPPRLERTDLNMDGVQEVILSSRELTAIITPQYGGALYELDYRPLDFNLLNTLASRPEAYHKTFASQITTQADAGETPSIHDISRTMDEELREALKFDWHNRYSLLDHCLHPNTELSQMINNGFRELGDFVNQPYEATFKGKCVTLQRGGHLYTDSGILGLLIKKKLELRGAELSIRYSLTNRSASALEFLFAPEFNFSMLSGDDEQLRYLIPEHGLTQPKLNNFGEAQECSEIGVEDGHKGIKISLSLDKKATFWYLPVQTVSQSESGFELNYQSSVLIPAWRVALRPEENIEFSIELRVQNLRKRG